MPKKKNREVQKILENPIDSSDMDNSEVLQDQETELEPEIEYLDLTKRS